MRQVLLLRGINVGSHNRIAMKELRAALAAGGLSDVRTYLQSGNVMCDSDAAPAVLAEEGRRVIAVAFGLDIPVIVRSRDELAGIVASDPLREVASDPKRYLVSFLDVELEQAALDSLSGLVAPQERLAATRLELYAWHPDGVSRSKLWNAIAAGRLGASVTTRNWSTVTSLLALASDQT